MARPRTGSNAVPTPVRILDAAETGFGEHPYAQARLADIARAAGVRRPSLLYHFPTKEALHVAVVDRLFADVLQRFADVVARDVARVATIDGLFSAWMSFIEDRPAFAPIVLRGVIDGHSPVQGHLKNRLVPLLEHVEGWITKVSPTPPSIPVRSAILQIGSDTLVRAAAGPLRGPLWGERDSMENVRGLFGLPVPTA
jgi:AcrR family transcriptional regulator